MTTRSQAVDRAARHLAETGSRFLPRRSGLHRDERLSLWLVDYYDPRTPDATLDGGCLAVRDDGTVTTVSSGDPEMSHEHMELTMSIVESLSLPEDWRKVLGEQAHLPYWEALQLFIRDERAQYEVFPPEKKVFRAFELTPYESVKVVIIGQDPYHGAGEAEGLSFSVPRDVPRPPSVRKIHTELQRDLSIDPPAHGNLESWASQGVLLLNTVLTVRKDDAGSHAGRGWETFTDRVIEVVNAKSERVVFLLWGGPAQQKASLITSEDHAVLRAAHPAARATARAQLVGSDCFSQANELLVEAGREPIEWGSISS